MQHEEKLPIIVLIDNIICQRILIHHIKRVKYCLHRGLPNANKNILLSNNNYLWWAAEVTAFWPLVRISSEPLFW
jgi:hypothetical protein